MALIFAGNIVMAHKNLQSMGDTSVYDCIQWLSVIVGIRSVKRLQPLTCKASGL